MFTAVWRNGVRPGASPETPGRGTARFCGVQEHRNDWVPMPLHVVEKVIGGLMVLDLRGRITLGPDTEIVRNKVKNVIETGHKRVILDLGGVSYIDSAGLSTLITCYISARKAGGEVKLLNLTKFVRDLLQITRLSTVFDTYDNLEAAQRSFDR